MRLKSTLERHQHYLNTPAVLMDTSALAWFAKHDEFPRCFERIFNAYMVLIPTPVLYELAFGTRDQAHGREVWLRDQLNSPVRQVSIHNVGLLKEQGKLPTNNMYVVNPEFNEWYSARERLIRLSTFEGSARVGKIKSMHTLDSLIHSCARNCFVPICSRDSDYHLLNSAASVTVHEGTVPIFTPEQLLQSLTEDVYCAPDSASLD